jgi:hypothetical protein
MKPILSFLKPVGKGLDWVRQGFVVFWRISKFSYFPTEKNLLLSFWYDFVHFKARGGGDDVYSFWDDRVVFLKQELENPDYSGKKKQLYRDLYNALHNPRLLKIIIQFLESSPPEDHYLPVVEALKRAWRDDGQLMTAPEETENAKAPGKGGLSSNVPELNAKAYYIAAELYYELAGRSGDFQVFYTNMAELKAFVQKQFSVAQLPGTFDKLKAYTYKKILTSGKKGPIGQLKPHFRQIADNPQVFGEAIAGRAREILAEHFN